MWNVFIRYRDGNSEFYDSVPDADVADEIIRGLEEDDENAERAGCPPTGCTYFKEWEER